MLSHTYFKRRNIPGWVRILFPYPRQTMGLFMRAEGSIWGMSSLRYEYPRVTGAGVIPGLLAQASACAFPDRKRPLPAGRLTRFDQWYNTENRHRSARCFDRDKQAGQVIPAVRRSVSLPAGSGRFRSGKAQADACASNAGIFIPQRTHAPDASCRPHENAHRLARIREKVNLNHVRTLEPDAGNQTEDRQPTVSTAGRVTGRLLL